MNARPRYLFRIMLIFYSAVFVAPITYAQMYMPSAPIDPKSREECNQHYQRFSALHRGLVNKASKLGDKAWSIVSDTIRQTRGASTGARRAKPYYDEASRISREASNILSRGSRERDDCLNQVRSYQESVRNMGGNQAANAVRSESAQLLTSNARRQAEQYASNQWRSAGVTLHAKKQAERKLRQFSLARQAWQLINGNGTWDNRLSLIGDSTKQLNGLRPGGLLSKQLTAGSINIIMKHSRQLLNQLSSELSEFDKISYSPVSTSYVDLMRTASFAYDVKIGFSKSIYDKVKMANHSPADHPSWEVEDIMKTAMVVYDEKQARIARQNGVRLERRNEIEKVRQVQSGARGSKVVKERLNSSNYNDECKYLEERVKKQLGNDLGIENFDGYSSEMQNETRENAIRSVRQILNGCSR